MSKILHSVQNYLSDLSSKHVVVAYSGGVDSQVLLHALSTLSQQKKISVQLTACHVNHGLSNNASAWQEFAVQQCGQLKVPLKVISVAIEREAQKSLEALARDKRYKAFEDGHESGVLVLTGHHQDDQIETFLLALKRGSGLKGLSAMAGLSKFGKKDQLLGRPLLKHSRQEIIEYAQRYNLVWVEDESNGDLQFDRNYLRHEILPKLESRWPSIGNSVERSIGHLVEAQSLLDEIAEQDLKQCRIDDTTLCLTALHTLSLPRFNQVVRSFLASNRCLMPSQQQLNQLYRQIDADFDKTPEVKVGEKWLRRHRGRLYLTNTFASIVKWESSFLLSQVSVGPVEIELPDRLGQLSFAMGDISIPNECYHEIEVPIDCEKLTIQFSHKNPICIPEYRQHHRVLKKVLQELSIAPWERKRIPFLFCGEQLVAAIGYFVCKPFLPRCNTRKVNVSWLRD